MGKQLTKFKTPNDLLLSYQGQFEKALAGAMDSERFVRILCTQVNSSDQLRNIAVNNPVSLIGASLEMAATGLDPSIPNECFLVPYKNEAVCQYGYKGLAKLALDSAKDLGNPLTVLRTDIIRANDEYDRESGDTPTVTHKYPPFGEDRGDVLGYYAVAKDAAGRVSFLERTVAEIKEHKKRFCKSKGGPWADPKNFDAYGLKTVLRLLISKELTMGKKLARAIHSDIKGETQEEPLTVDVTPDVKVDVPKEPEPVNEDDGPWLYDLSPLKEDEEKIIKIHEYLTNGGAKCVDEEMLSWESEKLLKKAVAYATRKEGEAEEEATDSRKGIKRQLR